MSNKRTPQEEYDALKKACYVQDGSRLKKNAKAEDKARLLELQDELAITPELPPDPQSRIETEEKHGKVVIKVARGMPMALQGKNKLDEWEVISVVSSHGAAGVKVPVGKFSEYRLHPEVNTLMTHKPPEVVMGPHSKKKHPKIMKENE